MKFDSWSFQVQGNAPIQEDTVLVNADRKVWIVGDGFGGSAGKAAAEHVAKYLAEFIEQESGDLDATLPFEIRRYFSLAGNVLYNAVAYANRKWNDKMGEKLWQESGGASALAVFVEGTRMAFASVGACRIFLYRNGKVQRLNSPKSLASWISPSGDYEGTDYELPLMSFGTVNQLEPEIGELKLQVGDQILLETSGVNDIIRTELLVHEVRDNHLLGDSRQTDHWHPERNASGILIRINEA